MAKHLVALDEFIDEDGSITIGHGAGGLMSQALIDFLLKDVEKKNLPNAIGTRELDDGATVPGIDKNNYMVVTTDGHTVDPLFFPGGNLGKLAVCGTVNDVLMMGGTPVAITHAVFIEEGFSFKQLREVNDGFVKTANQAKLVIIAGDTKVMPKGSLQGIISATTGIGFVGKGELVTDAGVRAGDEIVVTGTLGDHGTALLAKRKGLSFETDLISDVKLLTGEVNAIKNYNPTAMKDPTRGGLATALNEFALKSGVSIWLDEKKIPFQPATIAACDMLGLNKYELASEGRVVLAVPRGSGKMIVDDLINNCNCKDATIVGEARSEKPGKVFIRTKIGGTRILPIPLGESIPRVC